MIGLFRQSERKLSLRETLDGEREQEVGVKVSLVQRAGSYANG